MGLLLSLVRRTRKILILGPRGEGKTKLLGQIAEVYQIKPKGNPCKHFNFLRCKHFNIWDLDAGKSSFEMWPYYYDNASGIIYAYDVDNPHISDAILRELSNAKELRQSVFLVLLSKMDENLQTTEQRIQRILKNRKTKIIACENKIPNAEIRQGLEWITRNV